MSIVTGSRDIIALLRDIRAALNGDVPTLRKLAQEVTLQDMLTVLGDIKEDPLPRTLVDAFGRQRTSGISTVFDSKQTVDNQPLQWDTGLTGTGAAVYDNSQAATVLTVNAAGDSALRQTYRRFNYQPGKSQLIYMTGVIRNAGAFDAGVTARIGQFDDNAGVLFQYDEAAGIQVCIRKNAADTLIPQAAWNLDTFDGTGPSGITIDVTKSQIFTINYEWLGVGSVWFGFVVDGLLHWVHRKDNSNVLESVYMQTPNNPFRYQLVSTTGASGSMTQICCSINSEGGDDPTGISFAMGMPAELSLLTGAFNKERVLLAFRYKSVSTSQVQINTDAISAVASSGTTNVMVFVMRIIRDPATQLRNSSNTGPPVLTWVPIVNSALEYAFPQSPSAFVVTDDFTGSSGHVLDMSSLRSSSSLKSVVRNSLKLGFSIAGESDILVLSAFPYDNVQVNVTYAWTEL